MIEKVVPKGPYLEIFGRVHNRRLGWITAGDEAISYKKNSNKSNNNINESKNINNPDSKIIEKIEIKKGTQR
jgi:N6-adenosine-specific RNA methylase IME4